MYDFIGRRVTSLDHGGRFLIWTTRRWANERKAKRCPIGAIGPVFAKWRLSTALPPFHEMMSILGKHARTELEFGHSDCGCIHDGEALLISLVRGIRLHPTRTMAATITLLVDSEWETPLLRAATRLEAAMGAAGLFPNAPRDAAPRPAPSPPPRGPSAAR